ncbi:MAG: PIN domain-containing protein [Hyphomicrobiales bacterium]|nr:PIN domain-containing protein [Hyphomicrobiales bacterium]
MVFLDTNVVVDLLRARRPLVRERYAKMRNLGARLALSTIALFELRYGAANSDRAEQNRRALDALLGESFEIVAFDADDAAEAGAIRAELQRSGKPIGPFDTLIAAQARRRGATLITNDAREFGRVQGLRVEDWASA